MYIYIKLNKIKKNVQSSAFWFSLQSTRRPLMIKATQITHQHQGLPLALN